MYVCKSGLAKQFAQTFVCLHKHCMKTSEVHNIFIGKHQLCTSV